MGERPVSERRAGSVEVARQVLETERQALSKVARELDDATLGAALDTLLACRGRIVCTGMGKSGIIAKKLAGTLASTGSPALFLHPAEAGHGDLGMIVDGDVVVALSHSGETAELLRLLPWIGRLGLGLIAIVGDLSSTLATEAGVALHAAIDAEACPLGLAPTASTTAQLALGDALAMALLNERGFSAEDFASMHPRGSLGRRLVRVRNVMHGGEQIPRVDRDTPLSDAIVEMTLKGLGMTVVLEPGGEVAGIITDGDLRRLLQAGTTLDVSADACMTDHPAHISPDALATEALLMLEERRITALIAVDEARRPVGIVHLHDLWRTQMI